MTPEEWHRIERLCLAALQQPLAARSEFLSRVCGDDELRRQVEHLIASYERTTSFLEAPLRSAALRVLAEQVRVEESHDSFLVGDVVFNRYKVLRSLGRGGMGEVFAATDLELDRRVALKTIRLGADRAQAMYRFKQEFRSLADLQHPNLIKLYDLVSDGRTWLFTMELVEGFNFLQYVRPDGNLDETRLRQVLVQLIHAVEAIHRSGKLHLDIKPTNVLVTTAGSIRLIDFGLITELLPADVTQTASSMGTPAYMAPEQYGGVPLSESTDWYSVGSMLYEALTGHVPFSGSAFDIYSKKQEQSPTPPSAVVPAVSEDLSALCMALLERAPDKRPPGQEILRRLLKQSQAETYEYERGERREPVFVGREVELRVLSEAYQESRSGYPVVVSIMGTSGIGKSALMRHFLETLDRYPGKVVVLSGRCYERESVPFKAVDRILDNLAQYLSRLPAITATALLPRDLDSLGRMFPMLQRVESIATAPAPRAVADAAEVRHRAFTSLKELLARLADRSPLVIVIDDMQWADADSFALLNEVIGTDGAPSVLLILSNRNEDTDASTYLESLLSVAAAKAPVHRLQVSELSYEDSLTLITSMLGAHRTEPSVLGAIARESGGIPFFIDQLAQFGGPASENVWSKDRGASAGSLDLSQLVAARIGTLPASACSLLEIIALAAQPLRLDQLKGAVGFDIHDDAALPMLRAQKLVRTKHHRNRLEIELYHDRIREAVVARIPSEARQVGHLALAASLERCGDPDAESLAHHYEEGKVFDKAAFYAELAAERAAAALAFDQAARLYKTALRLSTGSTPQKRKLRIAMAEALANAGRGPESAEQYLQAAKENSGNDALQLQQRGAEQFLRSGYLEQGLGILRRVSAALGLRLATTGRTLIPSLLLRRIQLWLRGLHYRERDAELIDPQQLLRIDVCWSLALGWSAIETLRGAEAQALHLLLALRAGEPQRVALALAAEAGYSTVRSMRSLRRVPRLLNLAIQTAKSSNNPHALGIATFSAAMQSWEKGDFLEAFQLCERAEDIYVHACKGVAWERETAQIYALASLAWMGRLKEFSERLPPLLAEAKKRGDRYAVAGLILVTRSWLAHLANDDADMADREIATAIRDWPSGGYHLQHFFALLGRFEVAIYRGNPECGAEIVRNEWKAIRRSLLLTNPAGRFFAAHLHACSFLAAASVVYCAPRIRDDLLRKATREIDCLRAQQMLPGAAMADLLSAGSAVIKGHVDSAVKLYRSAERGFESAHLLLYAAVALRRCGELVAGEEGQTLIATADTRMQSVGVKNPVRLVATLAPGF
jgi:eukaryotic-like serine/threonine-protein kinase